jgi:acetylornithine aminotransferase
MAHGVLTTSGAMANENALKIAFQAAMPARRVFAFDHAFAGRTLALAQVTDKAAYREGLPPTITVDHVPFPEDESGLWPCLDAMERARQRFPGDHAAFIIETIQGEGGYTVGHGPSLRALCQRCQDAGILVIADEVQTFGRLQAPFACQYFGFADLVDIIAIGKATQVCATLYTAAAKPRPGLVSQTFTGSSTALHACAAIIDALGHGDFHGGHGRISQIESRCHRHLELLADEGLVRGPYGAGAMVACTPLGGGRKEVLALAQECFAEGLIAFVCGADPMRLRLLLPFGVISDGQIDQAFALLGRVLRRHQQELSG